MKNVPMITKEMLASESFKETLNGVIKACEIKCDYHRSRYEEFGEESDFNEVIIHSAVRDTVKLCEENFGSLLSMLICYQEQITPSPLELAQFMKTYGSLIEESSDVFEIQPLYKQYMEVMGEIVPFLFQVIVMSEVAKGNVGLIDLDLRTGLDTDGDKGHGFFDDDDDELAPTPY